MSSPQIGGSKSASPPSNTAPQNSSGKLRTDFTAVDSNSCYPTGSSLPADGLRVIARGTSSVIGKGERVLVKQAKPRP